MSTISAYYNKSSDIRYNMNGYRLNPKLDFNYMKKKVVFIPFNDLE